MYISFNQCKQLANSYPDLKAIVNGLTDQPEWITQELDIADIQAVQQGGCASGAYMPAVTYYDAVQTMSEHGDDVLQYIEDNYGELPQHTIISWSGIAVFYLSIAVELWCSQFDLTAVDWD